jgi:TonB family protein
MRAMGCETPYRHRFFMLVDRRSPWKQVALSTATQGGIVAAFLAMAAPHPAGLAPASREYHFVKLVVTPLGLSHKAVAASIPRALGFSLLAPSLVPVPVSVAHPSGKRGAARQEEATEAQRIELAAMPAPLPPAAPLIPRQVVKTNVFSTGSSEPAIGSSVPRRVETGGFDDSAGVASKSLVLRPAATALMAGFDLTAASRSPGGRDVGRIARPGIVGAGFAARTGDSGESPRGSPAMVSPAGFGEAGLAPFAPAPPKRTNPVEALPAEIVSKPTPVYTEEAKMLGIEGEVWLEVLFESSGKVQVVRVVRGLGHGLDEAAIQAAQRIRFKPALRNGQPADSTGVLHITFQLA